MRSCCSLVKERVVKSVSQGVRSDVATARHQVFLYQEHGHLGLRHLMRFKVVVSLEQEPLILQQGHLGAVQVLQSMQTSFFLVQIESKINYFSINIS